MVIVDARSKVATQGNRVMGLGTELVRYYEGIELFYGNIANIHTARDSLSEVQKLCFARDLAGNDSESGGATFWGRLDGTKWLSQVHSILCAAVKTVELVHYERTAVLVHCSDGWDRTPQITCLALMLLENGSGPLMGFLPYCRRSGSTLATSSMNGAATRTRARRTSGARCSYCLSTAASSCSNSFLQPLNSIKIYYCFY